nr:nuclease-related domain-containing protein [Motilibacter aurantiacus]
MSTGPSAQVRCSWADDVGVRVLALRRPDTCSGCLSPLEAGTRAAWDPGLRRVTCLACYAEARTVEPPALPAHPVPGPVRDDAPAQVASTVSAAGTSAQREYERRSQRREQQVRSRHPLLGGLILALGEEPATTRVWAQGARGERAVAAKLDGLDDVTVLHDRVRRHPDGRLSRANIDHIAITPSGVWVIDAKTHQGELEVRRSGGFLTARQERLYIRGRDQTKLLDGLAGQVADVTAALHAVDAAVPVRGALCFVGTELPWFGESINGVPLVGRRGLARLLKRNGDLGPDDRQLLAEFLATRFPPATG